ncbi:Dyp-type peroxidase [Aeromicrobium sp.]|uniref:Dyp-type peroxidase n=1 Tax=Aeromicrobium sp. TaxID=1871063 RepID=UPI002FCAA6E6
MRSETALVFVTLADGLDQSAVQQWLTQLADFIGALEAPPRRGTQLASAVIAMGPRFFTRFADHAANNPHGLASPIRLPSASIDADIFLHVSYTSESRLADLLRLLWETRPTVVAIDVEHGYARADGREAFGQLDGLRNLDRVQRRRATTVDPGTLPEEPAWFTGGSYAAYLKIEQNMDPWAGLDATTREQIIGRHASDGSRLDHEPGHNPHSEGAFTDPSTPPHASHVRKSGPRGSLHDQNLIFRRGVPYVEEIDNTLHFGLQFVSYQASLRDFDVVLNHWMLNPDFPERGSGLDSLVANNLITFLLSGVFVVVPHDDRFPAAGYFDPAPEPPHSRKGRIHIRKSAVDQNGVPTNAEVGDIEFQLFESDGVTAIGDPARTNPAGRAVFPAVRVGNTVIIRESPSDRFEPVADQTITVDKANVLVSVVNRLRPTAPAYGG